MEKRRRCSQSQLRVKQRRSGGNPSRGFAAPGAPYSRGRRGPPVLVHARRRSGQRRRRGAPPCAAATAPGASPPVRIHARRENHRRPPPASSPPPPASSPPRPPQLRRSPTHLHRCPASARLGSSAAPPRLVATPPQLLRRPASTPPPPRLSSVAARLGSSADWAAVAAAATPSKTARQCRHKVEKLRRRLRSKRRRPCPILDGIDLLDDPSSSPSRSHSPSPPPPASPLPPSPSPPKKRKRPDPDEGYAGESDVVQAVRAIGEGFVRAELRRMEAARETQRMRMEMALRHLDAQRRLLDGLVGRIVDALE